MKATKRINVEVLRKKFLPTIDAVQFVTGLQIIMAVRDFSIPTGTTAKAFFKKPSGKFVYQDCTISGNEIKIDVHNQALTEYGSVYYQVKLTNGSDILSTFAGKIEVEKSIADSSATTSETVVPAFDAAVQNAVAEIEEARDSAITYIGNGLDNTLKVEGKAADAAAAGKAIDELKGDLKSDNGIKGNQIDSEPYEEISDNLIGEFTDNAYHSSAGYVASHRELSTATADITGADSVIISCYTEPSSKLYPFVFYNGTNTISTGEITEFESLGNKTYKLKVPDGATHVHINVYTTDKETSVIKTIKIADKKQLKWLKVEPENLQQPVVDYIAENISDIKSYQINGEKIIHYIEPSDLKIESGYYHHDANRIPTLTASLKHYEISVSSGDSVRYYIGADYDVIAQGNKDSYFCIVDKDGICTEYFDVTLNNDFTYEFTVPDGGVKCYLTFYNESKAWVKVSKSEYCLDWLVLKTKNFKDNTIPYSAIIKEELKYKYGDSLLKPFNFNGKTAIAFGDSITAGIANEGSGNIGAGSNSYINIFARQVGLALTNRAVSGSTITYADGETLESLYTRISAMTETPDFIIISGGTNDYNQGKELGSFGDTDNTKFYGALYQICEKLKTNNSNATVIFITPINVTKDFNGHDRTLLNNYRNAIYEVATSYGFNVVNGADLVPVTGQTGYDDTIINHVDGCHPTIKGHGLYAKNLCGKLL